MTCFHCGASPSTVDVRVAPPLLPQRQGFRWYCRRSEVDCFGIFQEETTEPEADEVWDQDIDIIHLSTGSHDDMQSCCTNSKCHFMSFLFQGAVTRHFHCFNTLYSRCQDGSTAAPTEAGFQMVVLDIIHFSTYDDHVAQIASESTGLDGHMRRYTCFSIRLDVRVAPPLLPRRQGFQRVLLLGNEDLMGWVRLQPALRPTPRRPGPLTSESLLRATAVPAPTRRTDFRWTVEPRRHENETGQVCEMCGLERKRWTSCVCKIQYIVVSK